MLPTVRRMVVASSVAAPPVASAAFSASAVTATSAAAAGTTTVTGGTAYGASYRPFPLEFCRKQQQQRRYSSSKPSSPDNGSKALPGGGSESGGSTTTGTGSGVSSSSPAASSPDSSVTSASTSSSPSTSSSTATQSAKRKRKARESRVTGMAAVPTVPVHKLPSVPSTQHLPIETIALSAFFSQHRPISITHSLPKLVSNDAFASIFAPRARSSNRLGGSSGGSSARKTSDVIRTLSRAVDELETPLNGSSLASKTARRSKESQQQQREIERALEQGQEEDEHEALQQLSSDPSGAVHQLTSLSGHFLPFQPPPPPVPMKIGLAEDIDVTGTVSREQAIYDGADGGVEIYLGKNGSASAAKAKLAVDTSGDDVAAVSSEGHGLADFGEQSRTTRVFKALLTIEEQTDENGQVRIVAHSPEILEDDDGTNEHHASDLTLPSLDTSVIPRTFFERMALRQLRYDDALRRQRQHLPASQQSPRMLAISVRRQKKLKMKKKKYKKLMKRTRTLRRKLDRN